MADDKKEEEEHVSFRDLSFAIGQNGDGSFNSFPLSELARRTRERNRQENEPLTERELIDIASDHYERH